MTSVEYLSTDYEIIIKELSFDISADGFPEVFVHYSLKKDNVLVSLMAECNAPCEFSIEVASFCSIAGQLCVQDIFVDQDEQDKFVGDLERAASNFWRRQDD